MLVLFVFGTMVDRVEEWLTRMVDGATAALDELTRVMVVGVYAYAILVCSVLLMLLLPLLTAQGARQK